MRIIIIILTVLLMNRCLRRDEIEHQYSQVILTEATVNQSVSSIKSEKLKKVLSSYISRVNIVSYSDKLPIYLIIFRYNKNEKYLSILGAHSLPVFTNTPMNDSLELKGFCQYSNKQVLIYDKINGIGYSFYDPTKLNKDTIAFFKEEYGKIDDMDNIVHPIWIFKIRPQGKLVITKKTKTAKLK